MDATRAQHHSHASTWMFARNYVLIRQADMLHVSWLPQIMELKINMSVEGIATSDLKSNEV